MMSGIGDKDELASNKVDCIAHVPGVGKNLQVGVGVKTHVSAFFYLPLCRTNDKGVIETVLWFDFSSTTIRV